MARVRRRSKKGFYLFVLVLIFIIAVGIKAKQPDILQKYDVSYVRINLKKDNLHVVPIVANGPSGESCDSMIRRSRPLAAIAGTYFDPSYRPLGDIVSGGKVLYRGNQKQGIGFSKNGDIVYLRKSGRKPLSWKSLESGVACGPRLLRDGKSDLNYKRDGFSKSAGRVLASRCIIGSDDEGNLMLCTISESVSLATTVEILKKIGFVDALNLDGGRSCMLFYKGRYLREPVADMSNLITVQKRRR